MFLFGLAIVRLNSGEKCGSSDIAFKVARTKTSRFAGPQMDCSGYHGAAYEDIEFQGIQISPRTRHRPERCFLLGVCGDGRRHEGAYCGKGPCNTAGYNCDGGCIEGDPVESFKNLCKDDIYVYDVEYM